MSFIIQEVLFLNEVSLVEKMKEEINMIVKEEIIIIIKVIEEEVTEEEFIEINEFVEFLNGDKVKIKLEFFENDEKDENIFVLNGELEDFKEDFMNENQKFSRRVFFLVKQEFVEDGLQNVVKFLSYM